MHDIDAFGPSLAALMVAGIGIAILVKRFMDYRRRPFLQALREIERQAQLDASEEQRKWDDYFAGRTAAPTADRVVFFERGDFQINSKGKIFVCTRPGFDPEWSDPYTVDTPASRYQGVTNEQ